MLIINLKHNAKGHIMTLYSFKVRLIVGIQFPTRLWSTPRKVTPIMWEINVGLANCKKLQITRAFMWSSPLCFTYESIKVFSFVGTRYLLDREGTETFCAFLYRISILSFMELVGLLSFLEVGILSRLLVLTFSFDQDIKSYAVAMNKVSSVLSFEWLWSGRYYYLHAKVV